MSSSNVGIMSKRKTITFFVPEDGIDRDVISSDLGLYLGPDATVRPGKHEDNGVVTYGYKVTAGRMLTTEQIADLQASTIKWRLEMSRNPGPSTQSRAPGGIIPRVPDTVNRSPNTMPGAYDQSVVFQDLRDQRMEPRQPQNEYAPQRQMQPLPQSYDREGRPIYNSPAQRQPAYNPPQDRFIEGNYPLQQPQQRQQYEVRDPREIPGSSRPNLYDNNEYQRQPQPNQYSGRGGPAYQPPPVLPSSYNRQSPDQQYPPPSRNAAVPQRRDPMDTEMDYGEDLSYQQGNQSPGDQNYEPFRSTRGDMEPPAKQPKSSKYGRR